MNQCSLPSAPTILVTFSHVGSTPPTPSPTLFTPDSTLPASVAPPSESLSPTTQRFLPASTTLTTLSMPGTPSTPAGALSTSRAVPSSKALLLLLLLKLLLLVLAAAVTWPAATMPPAAPLLRTALPPLLLALLMLFLALVFLVVVVVVLAMATLGLATVPPRHQWRCPGPRR